VVPAPVRPKSSEPVDGRSLLVRATPDDADRAAADLDSRTFVPPPAETASLRVDASGPAERGVFETFLGALMGFLFG
jgi:hypothetical protein